MSLACNSMYSCMYTGWLCRDSTLAWSKEECVADQIPAPHFKNEKEDNNTKDEPEMSRPLREKNCRKPGRYTHVPHKNKPPQVVAKRNARERRRVQAVNTAFMRLRKAVPMENNRGKRISKVKTLQYAIDYINQLQSLLEMDSEYRTLNVISNYMYTPSNDLFQDFDYSDQDF